MKREICELNTPDDNVSKNNEISNNDRKKLLPLDRSYTVHKDTSLLTEAEKKEWKQLDKNTIDEIGLSHVRDNKGKNIDVKEADYITPYGNQEDTNGKFNSDTWKKDKLKKGDTIYQISDNGNTPSSYFTDSKTVDSCRNTNGNIDYNLLKNKLQIEDKNNSKLYLTKYKVDSDKDVAVLSGTANENEQFGCGGGNQYFVPNAKKLKDNGTLKESK